MNTDWCDPSVFFFLQSMPISVFICIWRKCRCVWFNSIDNHIWLEFTKKKTPK